MFLFTVLDGIHAWIDRVFTPLAQKRVGAAIMILTMPLYPIGLLVDEPLLVYMMSAGALTLTGWGIVVGAQALAAIDDQTNPPDSK